MIRALTTQIEETEYLQPAERLPMHRWAEENYVLSEETSEIAGPWSNDYTPYLVPIMDWLDDPFCRQVTFVACTQAGKSELTNIFVGYTVDQEPAPLLICMPREDDANRRLATRIRPMFKANTDLKKHLQGGRLDKLNIGKETILDNMILFIAWSNSPAALADNPICIEILDEVGKYPASVGREADPISLGKKRQRTFRTRSKLLITSTPVAEDDLLDAEYKHGDGCDLWVPCLACEKWHQIDWFNVELDKTADGNLLTPDEYEQGGHARYKCPKCGGCFDDYQRWEMVLAGQYVPAGGCVNEAGAVVGKFNISHHSCRVHCMMLHPVFTTMDDLASDWAKANIAKKRGDIKPLQDFFNSQLALPWRQTEQTTALDIVKKHIGRRRMDIVPKTCKMLTAGIDVQADHVWYIIIGWGYLSECWLVSAGRLETGDTRILSNYDLVRNLCASKWPIEVSKGEPTHVMRLAASAIDCAYHTDTVQDFVMQCTESNIMAVRGDDRVKSAVYRVFKHPDKQTVRYDINVDILKDRLHRLLYESVVSGPGFMHMPADMPGDYLKHFASEEKRMVRTSRYKQVMRWVIKHGAVFNHLWDTTVYALFAAEIMGARLISDEDFKQPRPKRPGRIIKRTRRLRTKY